MSTFQLLFYTAMASCSVHGAFMWCNLSLGMVLSAQDEYSYSLLSDGRKVALHCDLLMMVLHESKPGFPLILPGYLITYT